MVELRYSIKLHQNKSSLFKDKSLLLSRLDMEITERCNNNCIHCCINLPAKDCSAFEKELSTSEIKEILEEAASLGCLSVRFTGGEPLLRGDFEEIYLHARKLGLKVVLFTNGTLITQHLADLFAHIPPLDRIEITVYGMKKESCEAITRNPGSFEATREGINLLKERRVPFVVKGALLPPNKEEVEKFEAWASTIPAMGGSLPSFSMFFDLRCRRDSEEKNRQIEKLRLSPEEGLRFFTRRQERYLKCKRQFCSKFMRPPGDKLFACGSGIGGSCVDPYGNLKPCLMLGHPDTNYCLKKGSFRDAMTNFFPEIRETKAKNTNYLLRCARCFLKGLCEQCPAKSWTEHGTLDSPVEYLCAVAHVQARFLGLLKEREAAWEVGDWKERIIEFSKIEQDNIFFEKS